MANIQLHDGHEADEKVVKAVLINLQALLEAGHLLAVSDLVVACKDPNYRILFPDCMEVLRSYMGGVDVTTDGQLDTSPTLKAIVLTLIDWDEAAMELTFKDLSTQG